MCKQDRPLFVATDSFVSDYELLLCVTWISSRRSSLYVLMLSISIFSSAVKSEETDQKKHKFSE